MDGLENM